jgi:hypothetical protein
MHLAARVNRAISQQMSDGINHVNQVLMDSIRKSGVDE